MDKDHFLIRFFKSNKRKLNSTIGPILRSPDVLVSWKNRVSDQISEKKMWSYINEVSTPCRNNMQHSFTGYPLV